MGELTGAKTDNRQKPIAPSEVAEDQLVMQFMFRKGGRLLVFEVHGPVRQFIKDQVTREKAIEQVLLATLSNAAALYDMQVGYLEPEVESILTTPKEDSRIIVP